MITLSQLPFATLPVALLLMASGICSHAAERHGQVSIGYQYITIDGFQTTNGKVDIGTADTQSLSFDADFHIGERWTLSAGLPLIAKRYNGGIPHLPSALVPPSDDPLIDDGHYHTRFQDLHLGARYLLRTDPVTIEPFAYLGIPSNDYPFFGHAAVGQNLRRLEIGATFVYYPPLSDMYYMLKPSYSFVEKTLGVSINHWRLDAEAGYFLSPTWSVRAFVLAKEGRGSDFPNDFIFPLADERWHQHDRMVKHNYVNAGAGVNYRINERYKMSLSSMTMLHADQVHVMRYTITAALTRQF